MAKHVITCGINGAAISAEVDSGQTLLEFLRGELSLFGAKEGCGEGECGACTVMVNGRAVNSCLMLAVEADGCEVKTVEGLAQGGKLAILQEEFVQHDALQCGFCTPGMLMSARALLDRTSDPGEEEIKVAIAGNLCRCTGYLPIVSAIQAAAKREREETASE
ncbi:MAG: (2Fe-2S)-binding protein [Peptococcaceae bacterium]|nr:(2Fe-2S)-binding protein [Peptococcaceae bacterium]